MTVSAIQVQATQDTGLRADIDSPGDRRRTAHVDFVTKVVRVFIKAYLDEVRAETSTWSTAKKLTYLAWRTGLLKETLLAVEYLRQAVCCNGRASCILQIHHMAYHEHETANNTRLQVLVAQLLHVLAIWVLVALPPFSAVPDAVATLRHEFPIMPIGNTDRSITQAFTDLARQHNSRTAQAVRALRPTGDSSREKVFAVRLQWLQYHALATAESMSGYSLARIAWAIGHLNAESSEQLLHAHDVWRPLTGRRARVDSRRLARRIEVKATC